MRLLLFSGGVDSTALAWSERPDQLLFVDYGQCAAAGELRASQAIADELALPLSIRKVDFKQLGKGTLAGKGEGAAEAPEFWPFRNQMLITIAAMAYADRQPLEIIIGTVASDRIHPDGRGEFLHAMNALVGAQGAFSIIAPALDIDSQSLLQRTGLPVSVLGWTFSCHTGEWGCGQCRGCLKHEEAVRGYSGIG